MCSCSVVMMSRGIPCMTVLLLTACYTGEFSLQVNSDSRISNLNIGKGNNAERIALIQMGGMDSYGGNLSANHR
ncbi:uncharacterized protein BDV14DRAFT_183038 [Aspergillus stella-maris]|uniref:uncharacterized protein n=1 Tax=Aspergillus stella-maris TaxID=1810926 RepID=UPI003CCD30DB